jgi:hypothetical protein
MSNAEYNTEYLRNVYDELVRCSKAIDELEWEGDFVQADFLRNELRYLEALHEKGELYDPLF